MRRFRRAVQNTRNLQKARSAGMAGLKSGKTPAQARAMAEQAYKQMSTPAKGPSRRAVKAPDGAKNAGVNKFNALQAQKAARAAKGKNFTQAQKAAVSKFSNTKPSQVGAMQAQKAARGKGTPTNPSQVGAMQAQKTARGRSGGFAAMNRFAKNRGKK